MTAQIAGLKLVEDRLNIIGRFFLFVLSYGKLSVLLYGKMEEFFLHGLRARAKEKSRLENWKINLTVIKANQKHTEWFIILIKVFKERLGK